MCHRYQGHGQLQRDHETVCVVYCACYNYGLLYVINVDLSVHTPDTHN